MTPDLDTLLIALYVETGDYVIPAGERRPGQPKRLPGAELVCLAVAQVTLVKMLRPTNRFNHAAISAAPVIATAIAAASRRGRL